MSLARNNDEGKLRHTKESRHRILRPSFPGAKVSYRSGRSKNKAEGGVQGKVREQNARKAGNLAEESRKSDAGGNHWTQGCIRTHCVLPAHSQPRRDGARNAER